MPIKSTSSLIFLSLLTSGLFLFNSCKEAVPPYTLEIKANPYKIAPLTAQLQVKTEDLSRISVKVLGDIPVEQAYETAATEHNIPVMGLYPAAVNKIAVKLQFDGEEIRDTLQVTTAPLPDYFPEIEINTLDRSQMEDGMHACDIHFANYGKFNSVPLIFDDKGKVRWFMDLSFTKKMIAPFQRLKDGTLLMVDRHVIYEFNMLGKLIKGTKIDENYGMHHDVLELPDGNLLICVGKKDAYIKLGGRSVQSDSDFIILFDRKQQKITKEWDLARHLDVSRKDQNPLREGDWLHMNSLAFDEKDKSIIISGRHQGMIKISWDDELQWIMAPKQNWGKAGRQGNGADTKPYLLTALNAQNKPYGKAVQDGLSSPEDFDFAWGQHAPEFLPNGNLMVFDNGILRNYSGENLYSRAVEFEVNEEEKTFKQIWEYGKDRGAGFYSSIVSDVDRLPETGHFLVTSGFVNPNTKHAAKIVEVDYESGKEIFEATLYLKTKSGTKEPGWGQVDVLYRSERMELKY